MKYQAKSREVPGLGGPQEEQAQRWKERVSLGHKKMLLEAGAQVHGGGVEVRPGESGSYQTAKDHEGNTKGCLLCCVFCVKKTMIATDPQCSQQKRLEDMDPKALTRCYSGKSFELRISPIPHLSV